MLGRRTERRPLPAPDTLPRPWLASYPPGVPPTYDYPDVPLTRFLDDAARDFPDGAATVFAGETTSYADLLDRVDRLAAALADLGLGPGSRVALDLPPIPAAPVALFAVLRLGGVAVLVPPGLDGEALLAHLSATSSVAIVTVDEELGRLEEVHARLPRLRHVVATAPDDWMPFARRQMRRVWPPRLPGRRRPEVDALRLADLMEKSEATLAQARFDGAHPAVVVLEDGAARTLTHAQLLAATFQARLWIPDMQAGRERVLVLDHPDTAPALVTALLAPVLSAATLLLPGSTSPADALREIDRLRPTLTAISGELCAAIAEEAEETRRDLTSLRVGLVGPNPPPADAVTTLEERTEARMREWYGCARAPFTHANPVYGRALRGGIGLPVTDTVAVVVDPADPAEILATGEPGVLAVHGPQVAGGDDGWLVTAEKVTMDEDGHFRLLGVPGP